MSPVLKRGAGTIAQYLLPCRRGQRHRLTGLDRLLRSLPPSPPRALPACGVASQDPARPATRVAVLATLVLISRPFAAAPSGLVGRATPEIVKGQSAPSQPEPSPAREARYPANLIILTSPEEGSVDDRVLMHQRRANHAFARAAVVEAEAN